MERTGVFDCECGFFHVGLRCSRFDLEVMEDMDPVWTDSTVEKVHLARKQRRIRRRRRHMRAARLGDALDPSSDGIGMFALRAMGASTKETQLRLMTYCMDTWTRSQPGGCTMREVNAHDDA